MTPDQTSAALGIKRYVHLTVNRDSRHRLSALFEKYTAGVIVLLLEYQMTPWARSVRWEPWAGGAEDEVVFDQPCTRARTSIGANLASTNRPASSAARSR